MKLAYFCYLSYFKILPTTVIVHCCMQLPMLMFQSQHIVHINFRPWFDWGLVWSWSWGYKVLGLYACHDLGIHNTCDGIVTICWFSYPHILKVVFRYCQTGILFVPQNKSCVQCIFSWGMCYLSFCQLTLNLLNVIFVLNIYNLTQITLQYICHTSESDPHWLYVTIK